MNFWIPEGNHYENDGNHTNNNKFLVPEEAPKAKVICPASNDHELKIKKLYRVHLFDGKNSHYIMKVVIKNQRKYIVMLAQKLLSSRR